MPKLELEPQRELNVARPGTAGWHDRFGNEPCPPARRFRKRRQVFCTAAERDGTRARDTRSDEVRMVEDVEEFGAKLNQPAFSKESYLGVLHQREVPILERRPAQDVAAGVAQLT